MLTIDQLPAQTDLSYSDLLAGRDVSETVLSRYTKKSTVSQVMDMITKATPVEEYGAIGNGTDDDTTFIQAAINAVGPGGAVILAYGKSYKTTAQLTFNASYVTVIGYGATITSTNGTQWGKFAISGRTGIKILGLKFSCLYSTVAAQGYATIDIGDSVETLVRDCEINDTPMGIRILGASVRTCIEHNHFYKNFLAINSDDDLVAGPTYNQIWMNTIRNGLDQVGTSGSGGIKIDDTTAATNSYAGHIIALNQISLPGQVGIEVFDDTNGCVINSNTIYGAQWGITCDGVDDCSIVGNTIRGCTLFGIEIVHASNCTIGPNTVDGHDTTGTSVTPVGIVLNQCSGCSVNGGTVRYITDKSLWAVDSNGTYFNGVKVSDHYIGVEIKNTTDFGITGCGLVATGGALHFIRIDCNDASCERGIITGNELKGNVSQQGIRFYTPTALLGIQDLVISDNNIGGAVGASDLLDNGSSGAGFVRRVSVFNNPCSAAPHWSICLEFPTTVHNSNQSLSFRHKTVLCDASGGAFTETLPDPAGIAGEVKLILKTDASVNAVSLATAAGSILGTYNLNAQYKRVAVKSDNVNWYVIDSN